MPKQRWDYLIPDDLSRDRLCSKGRGKAFRRPLGSKRELWSFPGEVLPKELERFRPANAPEGAVEKIILDIPFSYRDIAAKAGAQWDSIGQSSARPD
jgi:hypothetical protein